MEGIIGKKGIIDSGLECTTTQYKPSAIREIWVKGKELKLKKQEPPIQQEMKNGGWESRGIVIKVDKEKANEIIENRKEKGMFYLQDGKSFVGIDNRGGDAWTEDFKSKPTCIKWLVDL